MRRRGLEAVPLVEASGCGVLRVYEHGAHPDRTRRVSRASERLEQHAFAKPMALLGRVDRESHQHYDRDGLLTLPLGEPFGRVRRLDAAGGQGVAGLSLIHI